MPGPDPAHWLHRLTTAEWLAAAATELAHAETAVASRGKRAGLAHARRAAGMAWNAVLIDHPDERAGRSYMDHVVALCDDPAAPDAVRGAARELRDASMTRPTLVTLAPPGSSPDLAMVRAARTIVEHAQRVVTPS
jgi:hypothetical protein